MVDGLEQATGMSVAIPINENTKSIGSTSHAIGLDCMLGHEGPAADTANHRAIVDEFFKCTSHRKEIKTIRSRHAAFARQTRPDGQWLHQPADSVFDLFILKLRRIHDDRAG